MPFPCCPKKAPAHRVPHLLKPVVKFVQFVGAMFLIYVGMATCKAVLITSPAVAMETSLGTDRSHAPLIESEGSGNIHSVLNGVELLLYGAAAG